LKKKGSAPSLNIEKDYYSMNPMVRQNRVDLQKCLPEARGQEPKALMNFRNIKARRTDRITALQDGEHYVEVVMFRERLDFWHERPQNLGVLPLGHVMMNWR
jgi:hypothetical protein